MRLLRMENNKNNKNNIYNDEQLFGKPCAELSLLKLCHGEKECHEMEQLRGDTWLSGQYYAGNASSCEQDEAL